MDERIKYLLINYIILYILTLHISQKTYMFKYSTRSVVLHLPYGDFEFLLGSEQEPRQLFVWLIKANEQDLLHIWYLKTIRKTNVSLITCSYPCVSSSTASSIFNLCLQLM